LLLEIQMRYRKLLWSAVVCLRALKNATVHK
jgi:hypothetical protein